MAIFYHVCFVVPDLEGAMDDLTRTVGTQWAPATADTVGDWEYRMTFSRTGPPYIELIDGPAGSPWDSTLGPRCDHIGYWARSVTDGARRLTAEGFPAEFSACPFGRPYTYHRVGSLGVRVELMDATRRPAFTAAWGLPGDVFDGWGTVR